MSINALFIIIAGALWGIISIFVNGLHIIGFSSMEIVALRVSFSAVILALFLLIKDRKYLKIRLKDIPLFCGTGICSIVFFNFCYFQAIDIMGSSAVPALLLYTAPIFVMFMSLFLFKEKITIIKVLALVLTILGMCFLTGIIFGRAKISLMGFLYGIGSGFGYALYSIFGKFLLKRYSSITITLYTFVTASAVTLPLLLVNNNFQLVFRQDSLLISLGLALFSTIIPYLLYTKGLQKIETGRASILATIEPFVAAIVGVAIFNEGVTFEKIMGMALILCAIILLNIKSNKKHRL